jgi:ornithine carbamoyltransferase
MKSSNKDFIDLRDWSAEDLENILDLAERIKSGSIDSTSALSGKIFGLLFSVASTRTRVSFQVALHQMGGHGEYLNANDLQLSNRESLKDTAEVLNRYLDGLIVRMYNMNEYGKGREALELIARHTDFPVINALDDKDHPCQVIADILTMKERFGESFKEKKLVMTWGYSKRQKSPGVLHSMLTAGSLLGMNMTFAYPKGFDLDEEYVEFARSTITGAGGTLEFSNDLEEAAEEADIIYVKNWKALGMSSEEDMKVRESVREDWCISEPHFKKARPGAIYMDCLPLIREEQVTAEVADGPRSIIYDEAENRLYAQKAILQYLA